MSIIWNNMFDSLNLQFPYEICELIIKHYCSNIIRYRWIKYWKYGHARKDLWKFIINKLDKSDWRILHNYSSIRREWRVESLQWLLNTDRDIELIKMELDTGIWGKKLTCRVLGYN